MPTIANFVKLPFLLIYLFMKAGINVLAELRASGLSEIKTNV